MDFLKIPTRFIHLLTSYSHTSRLLVALHAESKPENQRGKKPAQWSLCAGCAGRKLCHKNNYGCWTPLNGCLQTQRGARAGKAQDASPLNVMTMKLFKKEFAMSEQKLANFARFYGWGISFCLILFFFSPRFCGAREKVSVLMPFFCQRFAPPPLHRAKPTLSRVKMFVGAKKHRALRRIERKISLNLFRRKLLSKGFSPRLSSLFVDGFLQPSHNRNYAENGRHRAIHWSDYRFYHSRRSRATKGKAGNYRTKPYCAPHSTRNRMLGFISIDFQFPCKQDFSQ
jgi:hypothetical protein